MKNLLVILTCLMLGGCAAPWNTNFPKIRTGLYRSEVDTLLGKPRSAEGRYGAEILFYRLASSPLDSDGSDTREYYVAFKDDRVISYGERLDDVTMFRSIQQYNAAWNAASMITQSAQQAAETASRPVQTYSTPAPATSFSEGWQTGYQEGWKEVKGQMALPPLPPLAPLPPLGRDTYKDGYNLGFVAGMKAARHG